MFDRMVAATIALVALAAHGHIAAHPAGAAVREYDLVIERREIDIAGSAAFGLTVNGGIPGPTLRFTEGDTARIRVRNGMDEETSIHWHGLLVPPGMDGVPLLSFPPIAPGATFTYEFPIRQSGTYWYHSHTTPAGADRRLRRDRHRSPASGPRRTRPGSRRAVLRLDATRIRTR